MIFFKKVYITKIPVVSKTPWKAKKNYFACTPEARGSSTIHCTWGQPASFSTYSIRANVPEPQRKWVKSKEDRKELCTGNCWRNSTEEFHGNKIWRWL